MKTTNAYASETSKCKSVEIVRKDIRSLVSNPRKMVFKGGRKYKQRKRRSDDSLNSVPTEMFRRSVWVHPRHIDADGFMFQMSTGV